MRLTLAPSSGTSSVSKMTLRVPVEALLFIIALPAAVSGQGNISAATFLLC